MFDRTVSPICECVSGERGVGGLRGEGRGGAGHPSLCDDYDDESCTARSIAQSRLLGWGACTGGSRRDATRRFQPLVS